MMQYFFLYCLFIYSYPACIDSVCERLIATYLKATRHCGHTHLM